MIQLSAGPAEHPHVYQWPNPQRWLALAVVLSMFSATAVWIFLKKGSRRLADALGTGEVKVKALTAVVLILATVQNVAVFFH